MSLPDLRNLPTDVPDQGLTPQGVLNTYNLAGLSGQGFTGKGTTIVFFAFDGFDQTDLDTFSTTFGLPRFTPTVVGGQPSAPRGETTMDLQVAHAIAPDAQKVVVNARPTVQGDGAYEKIGKMLESADQQFPGAVWSFSIGWGCDKLITAADLAPSAPHWPPHTPTAPRRSTPAVTWPAWNAKADKTGRRRPARMTSAWTRWPPCRR